MPRWAWRWPDRKHPSHPQVLYHVWNNTQTLVLWTVKQEEAELAPSLPTLVLKNVTQRVFKFAEQIHLPRSFPLSGPGGEGRYKRPLPIHKNHPFGLPGRCRGWAEGLGVSTNGCPSTWVETISIEVKYSAQILKILKKVLLASDN